MANVLITGSTGMIGKGVLLECIQSPEIDEITLINRTPVASENDKITEFVLRDFMDLHTIHDQLKGIDACFHCMGVSALGMSEEQYTKYTFQVSKKLADVCYAHNPKMTFIYVSGIGTDSSEKGRQMWARVKGRTENYILNKGFDRAYMFRPGFIIPEKGIKSRTKLYQRIYNVMRPFFPLLKRMDSITTTTKMGEAMISVIHNPKPEIIYLDNKTINRIAVEK